MNLDATTVTQGTLWRNRVLSLGGAGVAALAVVLLAPGWLSGTTRAVAAYDAGAAMLLVIYWTALLHDDARDTARRAGVEDPGRNLMLGTILISVVVGLLAAVSILGRGPHVPHNEIIVADLLAVTATVLGWLLIHSTFIFRYAHLFYYDSDDDGCAQRGLTFPGTEEPDDFDFAYFSFVLGMTFQVSDVQITDPGVRRVALTHGLISFAYNTAILALVVNLASGLLNSH